MGWALFFVVWYHGHRMSTSKKTGPVVIVNRAPRFHSLAYVGRQKRSDAGGESKDLVADLKPSEIRLDPGVNYVAREDYALCGGDLDEENKLHPLYFEDTLSEVDPVRLESYSAVEIAKISENPKHIKRWLAAERRAPVVAALKARLVKPKNLDAEIAA